jgi:MFS family permease
MRTLAPPSSPAVAVVEPNVYDRTFWLAYLANTLLVLANALTFRFAELVHYLGGSERVAGDIVAAALTLSVLVRLSVSHVIDDYGTRRMWACCSMLYICGCIMFLMAHDLSWWMYAARMAFVVGLTGMFACSVTHIQNHVPPHRRTEIIGNLGSSGFIGMVLGSNIGDWILRVVPDGRPQFLALFGGAAALGLCYLVIVMSITHGQQHDSPGPSAPAYRLLVRHWPGSVVLVALLMGSGIAVTTVFFTRFATSQGIDGIGTFFTGYAISAFCFRIAAQNWGHTIGRHWMLVRGLLGHAVGHLMLAYATEAWHFIIPSLVCGFGHALLFPGVVSLGAGAFPKQARGAGTAITLGFVDFGSVIFAPLLGRIIVYYGFQTMFLTSCVFTFTAAMIYSIIALRYPDEETRPPSPELTVGS